MACPWLTKLPMETNFRPVRDSMGKITPPTTLGFSVAPSITGIEEPYTSASRISTECPALSRAAARLTAAVLLPTPPLPETTATTRVLDSPRNAGASSEGPPWREVKSFCLSVSVMTPKSTSTLSTPSIIRSRSRTSVVILCFMGQPGVVRATPTLTLGPSISMPRIMFSETRSRPISGSLTSLKASRIPASENPSGGSCAPAGVRSTRSEAASVFTSSSAGSSEPGAPGGATGLASVPSAGDLSLPTRLRNQSTTAVNLLRCKRPDTRTILEVRRSSSAGKCYHTDSLPPHGPRPPSRPARPRKPEPRSGRPLPKESQVGSPLADHFEAPGLDGNIARHVPGDDLDTVSGTGQLTAQRGACLTSHARWQAGRAELLSVLLISAEASKL